MHEQRRLPGELRPALPAATNMPSTHTLRSASPSPDRPRRPPARAVPPYLQRVGFIPRSQDDFGGGGAYPEVHVAQFPLDLGRPGKATASTALVAIDAATGEARFDAIMTNLHPGQHVQTRLADVLEKTASDVIRARPSAAEEDASAARTQAVLNGIVASRLAATRPGYEAHAAAASKAAEAKYIRYTPAEDAPGYNPATKQRIVRMVEAPIDPMEPPKFKHKKVPRGPPDAPVPVLHSPPRKVTVADQAAWKIPPSISSWKNVSGSVVPLDKRLAADGRSLLEPTMNDNFAKVSEALLIAERKARAEVETRAAIQRKLALKEKDAKEAELRSLASRARMERSGIANLVPGGGEGGQQQPQQHAFQQPPPFEGGGGGYASSAAPPHAGGANALPLGVGFITGGRGAAEAREDAAGDAAAAAERDALRRDHKRERERDLRLEASGKRSKATRDEDRDVSERLALGMPVGRGVGGTGEAQYDTRLFNQTEGVASGFAGEDGERVGGCGRRPVAAVAVEVYMRTTYLASLLPLPSPLPRIQRVLQAVEGRLRGGLHLPPQGGRRGRRRRVQRRGSGRRAGQAGRHLPLQAAH